MAPTPGSDPARGGAAGEAEAAGIPGALVASSDFVGEGVGVWTADEAPKRERPSMTLESATGEELEGRRDAAPTGEMRWWKPPMGDGAAGVDDAPASPEERELETEPTLAVVALDAPLASVMRRGRFRALPCR